MLFHVGDVVVCPLRGWYAVFGGGVFGRQAKGIPAHRHEYVVALHAQLAREHVVDGVVAHVAHVQLAAGVRQHGAGVEFFAAAVFAYAVNIGLAPGGLYGAFKLRGLVNFLHGCLLAGLVQGVMLMWFFRRMGYFRR